MKNNFEPLRNIQNILGSDCFLYRGVIKGIAVNYPYHFALHARFEVFRNGRDNCKRLYVGVLPLA